MTSIRMASGRDAELKKGPRSAEERPLVVSHGPPSPLLVQRLLQELDYWDQQRLPLSEYGNADNERCNESRLFAVVYTLARQRGPARVKAIAGARGLAIWISHSELHAELLRRKLEEQKAGETEAQIVARRSRAVRKMFQDITDKLKPLGISLEPVGSGFYLNLPGVNGLLESNSDESDASARQGRDAWDGMLDSDAIVPDLKAYLFAARTELKKSRLVEQLGIRLDKVRIPLRVIAYVPLRDVETEKARERFRRNAMFLDENQDASYRQIWAFRGDTPRGASTHAMELARLEPSLRLAVLLGDPGSGKTEWLKLTARHCVDKAVAWLRHRLSGQTAQIPIYLPLDRIAVEIADEKMLCRFVDHIGWTGQRQTYLSDSDRFAAATLLALSRRIAMSVRLLGWLWAVVRAQAADSTYTVALFLDAWDEVRQNQEELGRCLRAYAGNRPQRIVVSSRIVGYDGNLLPMDEGARELQICPFTPHETRRFVGLFFSTDDRRSSAMRSELRHKPSVAGMAQNPLLATLLCKAFSPSKTVAPIPLPARRTEVYERVLRGLLGEWEAFKKGRSADPTSISTKMSLLGMIARQFYPNEELRGDELGKYLREAEDAAQDDRSLAEAYGGNVDVVTGLCRDGVLVPAGGDTGGYMFLHLTFQEYLVARAICADKEPVASALSHVYDPMWVEPLSLCGGILKGSAPAYIAAMLAENKSDIAFRPFSIAVRATVECDEAFLPEDFEERLFRTAVDLCIKPMKWMDPQVLFRLLRTWGGRALPHFCFMLHSHEKDQLKAGILGLMNCGPDALDILRPFRRHQDPAIRRMAIRSIGGIGGGTVVSDMLDAVEDTDADVRKEAVIFLAEIGKTILRRIDVLMASGAEKRRAASGALASMRSPIALTRLIHLLNDSDDVVVANAILGIGWAGSPRGVKHLCPFLDRMGSDKRLGAVISLMNIRSVEATDLLRGLLRDKESEIRCLAIEGLGKSGTVRDIAAVMQAMNDGGSPEKVAALKALVKLAGAEMLDRAYAALADKGPEMRRAGLLCLKELKPSDMYDRASTLLHDKDGRVVKQAIHLLEDAGRVAAECLLPLTRSRREETKRLVIQTLGDIGTPDIMARLFTIQEKDKSMELCAAMAAVRIGVRHGVSLPPQNLPKTEQAEFCLRQEAIAKLLRGLA